MKRRDFLKATGTTGLFILFRASALAAPQLVPDRPAGYPMDFNAYLRIGADGRVGCFVGKVEMGQGNMTSLAMLAAEELDVPLERVDMLMGDTDLCPWDGGTGGSLSIWQFGPVLRGAAAEARAVLLQMAGEQLQVPADRLEVKAGVVSVKGDPARQVAYGELVQGRRIERHLADVKPKPVSAYTLVGKDAPRKDALEKVTGKARFTADYGAARHAPRLHRPAPGPRHDAQERRHLRRRAHARRAGAAGRQPGGGAARVPGPGAQGPGPGQGQLRRHPAVPGRPLHLPPPRGHGGHRQGGGPRGRPEGRGGPGRHPGGGGLPATPTWPTPPSSRTPRWRNGRTAG